MRARLLAGCLLVALATACDPGPDGADGTDGVAGADGTSGVDGADGVSGENGYAVLSESQEVAEARFGCEEGYRQTRIGVDDGEGGGIAGDSTLQEGEVDVTLTECLTRNEGE